MIRLYFIETMPNTPISEEVKRKRDLGLGLDIDKVERTFEFLEYTIYSTKKDSQYEKHSSMPGLIMVHPGRVFFGFTSWLVI